MQRRGKGRERAARWRRGSTSLCQWWSSSGRPAAAATRRMIAPPRHRSWYGRRRRSDGSGECRRTGWPCTTEFSKIACTEWHVLIDSFSSFLCLAYQKLNPQLFVHGEGVGGVWRICSFCGLAWCRLTVLGYQHLCCMPKMIVIYRKNTCLYSEFLFQKIKLGRLSILMKACGCFGCFYTADNIFVWKFRGARWRPTRGP